MILFAKHETGYRALQTLLDLKAPVKAVFCEEAFAEKPWYKNIAFMAQMKGMEFVPVRRLSKQPELWEKIERIKPDFAYTVLFTQVFPEEVIKVIPAGLVNFHPSLLPAYRGPHPVNWAIINGETKSGVTAHFVTKEVDAGPVILQNEFEIRPDDTLNEVMPRVEDLILRQLGETYDLYKKKALKGRPQDEVKASYHKMRGPEDGKVSFHAMTAKQVYDMIRSLPAPLYGAFADYKGSHVIFRAGKISEGSLKPGEIKTGNDFIEAGTKKGVIRLTKIENEKGEAVAPAFFKGGAF